MTLLAPRGWFWNVLDDSQATQLHQHFFEHPESGILPERNCILNDRSQVEPFALREATPAPSRDYCLCYKRSTLQLHLVTSSVHGLQTFQPVATIRFFLTLYLVQASKRSDNANFANFLYIISLSYYPNNNRSLI